MAVWQFKFSLVPTRGIVAIHGKITTKLNEYGPIMGGDILSKTYPNYWGENIKDKFLNERVFLILPEREPWSEEAKMFGDSQSNSIEIWEDDIFFEMDLRCFPVDIFLEAMDFAKRHECKVVLSGTGEVLDPDIDEMLKIVNQSDPYKFCENPELYLKNLPKDKLKI